MTRLPETSIPAVVLRLSRFMRAPMFVSQSVDFDQPVARFREEVKAVIGKASGFPLSALGGRSVAYEH
jgi:hypothetical protein